ncbi:MAG: M67 family metallopeptidase [Chloroherpetonaceae bacterium]|nr:M67 family metallopeptidase [Chthonomonadaceae bacterium]MDW8209363.1 M67 family metallopeptidase [Chloroherpetonaceae bacterium]
MIHLSEAHVQAIRAHGAEDFPCECVGVLLGDVEGDTKVVREVRRLTNVFTPNEEFERSVVGADGEVALHGRERRFQIAPDTMFRLMQEERQTGLRVLGFYHSHPDHPAHPSAYDLEWASPWYSYLILSVRQGQPAELTCWTLDTERHVFLPEAIQVA